MPPCKLFYKGFFLSFVQIRRKHLQKKTDTEPWMILEKALRNLDTTRPTFSSQNPGNDIVAHNTAYGSLRKGF